MRLSNGFQAAGLAIIMLLLLSYYGPMVFALTENSPDETVKWFTRIGFLLVAIAGMILGPWLISQGKSTSPTQIMKGLITAGLSYPINWLWALFVVPTINTYLSGTIQIMFLIISLLGMAITQFVMPILIMFGKGDRE